MTDDLSLWVQIFANFGFPMGMTLYLLIRFEKKIDALRETIKDLIDVITKNSS